MFINQTTEEALQIIYTIASLFEICGALPRWINWIPIPTTTVGQNLTLSNCFVIEGTPYLNPLYLHTSVGVFRFPSFDMVNDIENFKYKIRQNPILRYLPICPFIPRQTCSFWVVTQFRKKKYYPPIDLLITFYLIQKIENFDNLIFSEMFISYRNRFFSQQKIQYYQNEKYISSEDKIIETIEEFRNG